jgi:hypothetical protein
MKRKMMEKEILLKCFLRNPSHKKEIKDGQLCADPLTTAHRRSIFIKRPCNPLQGIVNFDIPLFEGLIDADVVDKWLNLLEGYFSFHNFSDREKITFSLLKVIPQC